MTKLTEDMIRQRLRNCSSAIETIRKINITGRDLEDISLLRRMTSIEILSLSVNKISTLSDLQQCKNLKELYLRKNNITNLNEIYYIKDLPCLTVLGLSQNPCSNDSNYRFTILKNIPYLEKLDDIAVTPEEKAEALKKGRKIRHPRDIDEDTTEGPNRTSSQGKLAGDGGRCGDPAKCNRIIETDPDRYEDLCLWCKTNRRPLAPGNKNRPSKDTWPTEKGFHPKPGHVIDPSNILAGILILVKELDYPTLELLHINVKNRLNDQRLNY